jgi:hypothetical protein
MMIEALPVAAVAAVRGRSHWLGEVFSTMAPL